MQLSKSRTMRFFIPTLLAAFACFSSLAYAQPIPKNVREVIENHFPGWRINKYSFPSGCIEGQSEVLDSTARSFYSCKLNEDEKADYACRFVTGHDSSLIEYFVALVSNASSYDVFVLDSCTASRGAGNRYLQVLRAGRQTAFFFDDTTSALFNYAEAGNDGQVFFLVDAVMIQPVCESYYKAIGELGYVFIRDRFYEFHTGE